MSAAARRPGRFLVLEGIDGCGKTTQLEALRRWLPESGLLAEGASVVVTREPGGTALGRALREMLLHPPEGAVPATITELLLYAADRAQHVQECILPALASGDWVLCDRFSGSTAAYQGHGRGLPLDLIGQLETLATAGLVPDLTLWLEIPLDQALRRRRGRAADRIEDGGAEFLARVCAGFAQLAVERGWQRIDARAPLGQVTLACRERLRACLGPPGGPRHSADG